MKELSQKEFLEAPPDVQFIYINAKSNLCINSKIVEDAIAEYPEYFPDEVELMEKWAKIPQSVHDEYSAERKKMEEQCYKELPPSKGILGWIDDPKGHEEWVASYEKCNKTLEPLASALHEKYYSQYGIKWNGF